MSMETALFIEVKKAAGLWERLRSARTCFLALDYDGTLAPFHHIRMEAYPLPGITDLIGKIRDKTGGAIAVISGRPLAEVEHLLNVPGIMMVGSHGYEFRYPDGSMTVREPTARQRQGLGKAREADAIGGLGTRVEIKVGGIALHTRGMSVGEALSLEQRVHDSWTPIARLHDLEVRSFNGGIELRCPGTDKGGALKELLSRLREDTFSVYVGDDDTDEDAFRVVKDHGLGIRVGNPNEPTEASGFLPDIQAVQEFLQGWVALAPAGSSGGITWKNEDWR